jgi:transcription elongation factor/antiterminator RfaH
MPWYALYTKPRHEKTAAAALVEKQYETFLPLIVQTRKWKDRKKKVESPLFSSYLFCNFEYKYRFDVLQTRSIIKIVNFAGEPAVVPDWQIESLRQMLEFPETLRLENYLSQGDLVEVTDGPMRGLRGTVTKQKNEERLILTIDGIMQTVSVEIDTALVKKVKEEV